MPWAAPIGTGRGPANPYAMQVLRERLDEALDKLPRVSGQEGNLSIGNDLTRLLNLTDKLAQQNGDQFIASELFVLALADSDTKAAKIAKDRGIGGPLLAPSSYFMKSPPEQFTDDEARNRVRAFVDGHA